jgi:hypothetical protein
MNFATQAAKDAAIKAAQVVVDNAVGQPAIADAKEVLAETKAASVG